MGDLTTSEKLDAIANSGLKIAFDGCHKLYLIENDDDLEEAHSCGYSPSDIYAASRVRELVARSCFLVFLHPMSLQDHPWDIEQGTEDIFDA